MICGMVFITFSISPSIVIVGLSTRDNIVFDFVVFCDFPFNE